MPSFGFILGFVMCAYFVGNYHYESQKEIFLRGIIGAFYYLCNRNHLFYWN